jgi:hypothetical protein
MHPASSRGDIFWRWGSIERSTLQMCLIGASRFSSLPRRLASSLRTSRISACSGIGCPVAVGQHIRSFPRTSSVAVILMSAIAQVMELPRAAARGRTGTFSCGLSASHHGSEPWPRTFGSFRLNQLTGWGCWHPRRALTPFTQVRFLTREPISVGSPGVRAIQVLEVAKASRGAKLLWSATPRAAIYACRAASAADRALSAYDRNRAQPTVFIYGTENNLNQPAGVQPVEASAGSRSPRARPLTPTHDV